MTFPNFLDSLGLMISLRWWHASVDDSGVITVTNHFIIDHVYRDLMTAVYEFKYPIIARELCPSRDKGTDGKRLGLSPYWIALIRKASQNKIGPKSKVRRKIMEALNLAT